MKIQNRYFLFSVISALVLMVGLFGRFYLADPTNGFEILLSGVVFLIGLVLFCYNGYQTILWHSRAWEFKNVFGVNPPNNPWMNWKARTAIQPIVDQMLKNLASFLDEAYKAENKIKDMAPDSLEEARIRHDNLMKGIPKVESTNKVFRDNQDLAYEWGFEIHHDYRNYFDKNCRDEKHKKQF